MAFSTTKNLENIQFSNKANHKLIWALTFTVFLSLPVGNAKPFYIGGDPAAGSPTATLLRLFP
ncbi:MAG: hypothetical protein C0193_01470, partial [Candidatus Bathyarchaeota archaeon]